MHIHAYRGAATLALLGCMLPATYRAEAAPRDRITIPADTVVRLHLTETVSSRDAAMGDPVRAELDAEDTSGFPRATRFDGVVVEVRRAGETRPGMLGMEFRRVILPNGTVARFKGEPVSLSDDGVRTSDDGRLVSRRRGGGVDWKWVGVGAAGGAVLGQIVGDDFLKGALLGGLGGAVYTYLDRDRGDYHNVTLDRDSMFGVRLDRDILFDRRSDYRYPERFPAGRQRVAGSRSELRAESVSLSVNGHDVDFKDARPLVIDTVVYVPLRSVADAAGWDYRHTAGSERFELTTDSDRVTGRTGERTVTRAGRTFTIEQAPMLVNGDVYVPLEYVSRAGATRVNWSSRDRREERRSDRDLLQEAPLDTGYSAPPAPRQPKLDLNRMVANLATADETRVEANITRYRVVNLSTRLAPDELKQLNAAINRSSTALRSQSLLTAMMRSGGQITTVQTVVGLSEEDRIIYVR